MTRLDILRRGAHSSGFTIDFLDTLTSGLSRHALRKVIDNVSSMPSTVKSSDSPHLFRKARAPASES